MHLLKHNQVELLQIWIEPNKKDLPPSYEQIPVSDDDKKGKLKLIASQNGKEGAITVHQDVKVYSSILKKKQSLSFNIEAGRHIWIQVIRGSIKVNNITVETGDGAALSDEPAAEIQADDDSEFLLFDLK